MTAPTSQPAVGDPVRAQLIAEIVASLSTTATGAVLITPSDPNTPTSAHVTFPSGRFTSAPIVLVTAVTALPGTAVTGVSVQNITAAGCDVYLTRTNTTATTVNWLAIDTP